MSRKLKVCKDFTYYSIIKEAIRSYPLERATSQQIFNYVTAKHPDLFKNSNSMTWKGNIRQLLSKCPEFIKMRKDQDSKLHFWSFKPIDQIRKEENELNTCLTNPFKINYPEEDLYRYGQYYYNYYMTDEDLFEEQYREMFYEGDIYGRGRYRDYYRRPRK